MAAGIILEEALATVSGIRGAKVQHDETGIHAVRVLVLPEKSTASALRDVQSKAQELGIPLDASNIQVLRTGDPSAAQTRQRRKLASVATTRSTEGFSVRVALELAGDFLIGESDAPESGPRFERRSVVRATLSGLNHLIDFPVDLESVYVLTVGDERYAVVILNRPDGTLVGSAAVRADEADAIARATLDALNRFVAKNLEEAGPASRPQPAAVSGATSEFE